MNKRLIISYILFLFPGTAGMVFAQNQDSFKLKTHMDSVSYVIGFENGTHYKNQGINLDANSFAQGLQQAVTGGKCALTDAERARIITSLQQELTRIQQEKQKLQKEAGKAFLEANKKKQGMIVTPSGLQYEILKQGTGKSPKASDEVTVNYTGKLIDGKIFDSSYGRGKPTTFMLSGVIPGWTEGLQLMKEGAKYRFYIPSELAYGERGFGNDIPPGATLVFEVELISVQVK